MKKEIKSTSNKKAALIKQPDASAHPPKVIILMSMPAPIHAVTAVMDMPHDYHGRVDRITEIFTKCTDNHYVPIAPHTIDEGYVKLATYVAAATAAEKNAAFPPVHNVCKSYMNLFQNAGNDDIANAIVIIESGGFKVKEMSIPQKHSFKAVNGAITGDTDLYAQGAPAGSTHNWKWATDGINYLWLRGTSDAHTHHVTGLAQGSTVYYIHELSLNDVPQTESQPFKLTIT